MKIHLVCTFIIFLFEIKLLLAANILGIMGVPSPSHHNWNRQIFINLARKGHNLTIFTPDIDKESTPNVHYVWAEKVYPTLYNGSDGINIMDLANDNAISGVISFHKWALVACKGFFESNGFSTLMNYPDDFKFELALVDFNCGPCLLGFLHKFNYPPVVGLSAFSVPPYIYDYVGGHRQPAYVPHYDVNFDNNMNFFQRVFNHLVIFWEDFYFSNYVLTQQNKMMKQYFNYSNLPNARELQRKIAIILVNTHFSYETVEPLPPNLIPVGGLQIRNPQPLDAKILEFIESSEKGTILFSLGTNVRSEFMGQEKKKAFASAFKQFPEYHFIWKYESVLNLKLSSNVMILPWVKQNDILAHPKLKAFISHCGGLSTQEASWYGIPVIGIPFFADQFRNIRYGVNAGTSVRLSYQTLTQKDIEDALEEVLGNEKYKINAKRRSALFQDQKEKPLERAIFWCEWLMRHPMDYEQIKLKRVHELGWFAANSYDVILFWILITFALTLVLYYCFSLFSGNKVQVTGRKDKEE